MRFKGLETFYDLVRRVVESFGAFGLDYMFTGALAASYCGVCIGNASKELRSLR